MQGEKHMNFEKVKKIASKAGEKAQDWSEKGLQASKEWVNKAGARAQDLGEKGVLVIEIKQLKGQTLKLIDSLGFEVYEALVTQQVAHITRDTPKIKEILGEINSIQNLIAQKETELQNRKDG
jgi:capsule polysaccharide export protein KpsE/RkpR